MHTAPELSQQRSPKMTLLSESELARGLCQDQVLSRQPSLAHSQAIKVKSWKLMSCKSQVLLEHCVGQVMQQLNKNVSLAGHVRHTCLAPVKGCFVLLCAAGPAARMSIQTELWPLLGFRDPVHPNIIKKKQLRSIFSYLALVVSSQSKNMLCP